MIRDKKEINEAFVHEGHTGVDSNHLICLPGTNSIIRNPPIRVL